MKTFLRALLFTFIFTSLIVMVPPVNTALKSQLMSAFAGPAGMITVNNRYFVEVNGMETLNSVCASNQVNGVSLIAKGYPVSSENIGHLFSQYSSYPYIYGSNVNPGQDLFAGDNSSSGLAIANCPNCRFQSGSNASFSCKPGTPATITQSAACQGISSLYVLRSCSSCNTLSNSASPGSLFSSIFGECQLPAAPPVIVPPATPPATPPTTPPPPPTTPANNPTLGIGIVRPSGYPAGPLINFEFKGTDDPQDGAQIINANGIEVPQGNFNYTFQDPAVGGYIVGAFFTIHLTNLDPGYVIGPSTTGISYIPHGDFLEFQYPASGILTVSVNIIPAPPLGPTATLVKDLYDEFKSNAANNTPEGRLQLQLEYLKIVLPIL